MELWLKRLTLSWKFVDQKFPEKISSRDLIAYVIANTRRCAGPVRIATVSM